VTATVTVPVTVTALIVIAEIWTGLVVIGVWHELGGRCVNCGELYHGYTYSLKEPLNIH
jgi:hypothetical protein